MQRSKPKPKRFSDFAEPGGPLEGVKVAIHDVLDIEILITSFRVNKSKFQQSATECVTIQFVYPEKPEEFHIIFTGSGVLCDLLRKYEVEIPFLAKIKKIERFFTLT